MEAIISKALGGNATITEQEESVKAINFILTQGKATEGHVTLVQVQKRKNTLYTKIAFFDSTLDQFYNDVHFLVICEAWVYITKTSFFLFCTPF